jgi:hypothetical protein
MQGQLSGQISSLGVQQQAAMARSQTGSAVAGLGMQTLSMMPSGSLSSGLSKVGDAFTLGTRGLGSFN